MPLCTIKIPRDKYDGIPPETRDEIIISSGNQALDITLNGLRIPDSEDREIRILVSKDIPETEMSLSFTVGPNEYPDFAPDQNSFFPRAEDIHHVGMEIQSEASNSPLNVSTTKMEAWSDTTFIICSPENKDEPKFLDNLEALQEIGKYINEPRVTLVVSPAMVEGASSNERESSREAESFENVAEKISDLLAESLGLPEQKERNTEVKVAQQADSGISIEFDCLPKEGHLIPQELREYVGRKIEHYLNTHGFIRNEGDAEIWIRQGNPETNIVTSAL
ncbi:hypothetical protein A3E13_03620 [Candidatus Woesebacteria bacterium RIFCSPHIGHO2_12_FULL_40_20]|nr:MAG: hypothetical protein A3E13_03620 [Candidatus Woesebacteria bacterium RIFCSPHIGHO2_12_FULL_40_20]OGM72216.1 MAG: hypothetical protein A3H19_02170 [Candidatus Woesebacteria bacterium RIFCSPLOWO2_12_FULL_39_9]